MPFNPNAVVDPGSPSNGLILMSSALVFIMTPGIGLFYSGLMRGKNALSVIFVSYLCMAIVTVEWFIWGFSLSFSESGSPFIGNFDYAGMMNLNANALTTEAAQISSITFFLFQLQFAAVTPAIIFGSVADRLRLIPCTVFIFAWTTLVYNFIAYWTWSGRGWLRNLSCLSTTSLDQIPCGLGYLDFAGGGPVHMTSGFAGLAFSIFLGKQAKRPTSGPANLTMVFLGTTLIWFGWFAFNGGSATESTARASLASVVTTICASFSAITWISFDYFFTRKISGVGFCTGAIAGLVVITPASGFVAPWAAAIMGVITGLVVNYFSRMKERLGFEDTLDAFGLHGVGGALGSFLTSIFHQKWIPALSGTVTMGGAIEGNGWGILYQLIGIISTTTYTFGMTFLILFVINRIPGLSFLDNNTEDDEKTDLQEIGINLVKQ